MPPTFAYVMCLMLYFVAMGIALFLCAVLLLFPSKRRIALRLAVAVVASLPGVLLFQFIVAIPLGILLAAVLGLYSVFHPPDSVQWAVGIPTIIIEVVSLSAASLLGCYSGGRIGWHVAGRTPFRDAIAQEPLFRFIWRRLRRRNA